jgi:magnesium transporter
MLYAYHPSTQTLDPVAKPPRSGWVHVVKPTQAEIATLRDELGVPHRFIRHALDLDEVARVDRMTDGSSLILLREPYREGMGKETRFRAVPLGVVVLDDLLVTISPTDNEITCDLLAMPDLAPEQPHRFLFQLILCTAERFLVQLRVIDREVARLEDELQASTRNREVLALLTYQKSLVHFTAALASNRIMLERLQKDPRFDISADDQDLLEDALVEIHQAIEMATISESVLSQMMDAFASIISNNLNVVMKVLTAFTMVLTFPMLIASYYGMNVDLPGQHLPHAFEILIGASLILAAAAVGLLWRKRWI